MSAPVSADLRSRVIAAYYNGEGSYRQIAKRFAIHFNSVAHWVQLYRSTGNLEPRYSLLGRSPKVTEEQQKIIQKFIAEDPDATLEELVERLHEKLGILIDNSTMSRYVTRLGLSLKKKTIYASERDDVRNVRKRRRFIKAMASLNAEDLIFLDETGSNLSMTRSYGRSPIGERCYDSVPAKRGKNTTLISALGYDGPITELTVEGAVDGQIFCEFIKKLLVPKLRPFNVVLLDNVSFHHNKEAIKSIRSMGAKVKFLPPYSPDLDPLEECFSKVKSILRKIGPRTKDALQSAYKKAIMSISKADVKGWYTHAGYL